MPASPSPGPTRVTTYEYNGRGKVVTRVGPGDGDAGIIHYVYDDLDRLTVRRVENGLDGADGDTTNDPTYRWTYNHLDLPTVEIDPEGYRKVIHYDGAGNQTQVVEAAGTTEARTTDFVQYDERNRVIQTRLDGTYLTTYEYDAAGNLTAEIDARGARKGYAYDAMNRLIETTDGEGNKTETIYDEVGNVVGVIDGRANGSRSDTTYLTTFVYDEVNRRVAMIDAAGDRTDYEYDEAGNIITITSPRTDEGGGRYVTRQQWDALNRLIEVEDAEGNKTEYLYDEMGHLTAVIDARAHGNRGSSAYRTTYHFDRITYRNDYVRDALGNVVYFDYDQAGNKIRERSPRDHQLVATEYAYDRLDRLTRTTYARTPPWRRSSPGPTTGWAG